MQAELTQIVGAPMMDVFGPIAGFSGHFSIESALVLLAFAMAGLLRRGLGRWGIAFLVIGLATVFNTVLEISYGLTFFNGGVAAFLLLAMGSAAIATLTSYIHRPIVRVLFVRGGPWPSDAHHGAGSPYDTVGRWLVPPFCAGIQTDSSAI
jgi:hypothetical protein